MAISDNYAPDISLGNGSTTVFSGGWKVLNASYFKAALQSVATGVQTPLVQGGGGADGYTLTFDDDGYEIDLNSAPSNAYYVVRYREVAIDQTDPYRTSKGFQGKVVEDSFDKLTAIDQDQQDQIDRSLKFQVGTAITDPSLPSPQDGYGVLWDGVTGKMRNTAAPLADLEGDAEIVADNIASVIINANNIGDINDVANNMGKINDVQHQLPSIVNVSNNIPAIQAVEANEADISTVAANIVDVQNAEENANIAKAAGGFTYTYSSTTTASDPGAGFLRFNNAAIASATALYISETTGMSQEIAAEIATWDDSTSVIHGKLRLFKQSNPSVFALFNVTGTITDNGSWDTVTVAYVGGSGSISNNDVLTIQYLRTGDKGDTGATGAPGTLPIATAGGTVDAITADFTPDITLSDKMLCCVRTSGANTITNPTFAPDGLTARTIVKKGGIALVAGDIPAAGAIIILQYDLTNTRWELVNPARTTAADLFSGSATAGQVYKADGSGGGSYGDAGGSYWEPITSSNTFVTNQAQIDFTSFVNQSNYYFYRIMIYGFFQNSGGQDINAYLSNNNGSSWGSDYDYAIRYGNNGGNFSNRSGDGAAAVELFDTSGGAANIEFILCSHPNVNTGHVMFRSNGQTEGGNITDKYAYTSGFFTLYSVSSVNALRLKAASGNVGMRGYTIEGLRHP